MSKADKKPFACNDDSCNKHDTYQYHGRADTSKCVKKKPADGTSDDAAAAFGGG